jgi:hypothetical protein
MEFWKYPNGTWHVSSMVQKTDEDSSQEPEFTRKAIFITPWPILPISGTLKVQQNLKLYFAIHGFI